MALLDEIFELLLVAVGQVVFDPDDKQLPDAFGYREPLHDRVDPMVHGLSVGLPHQSGHLGSLHRAEEEDSQCEQEKDF